MKKNNYAICGSSGEYPRKFANLTRSQILENVALLTEAHSHASLEQLIETSPVKIASEPGQQSQDFFSRICLPVPYYSVVLSSEDGKPEFPGVTFEHQELIESAFHLRDVGQGILFRPNPVAETGGGQNGCHKDVDTIAWNYVLLEGDCLSLEEQAAVLLKLIELGFDIRSIVYSGGKSLHALLWIGAKTPEQYRAQAKEIFKTLVPFGFDPATKNPSRLTRVPGCERLLKDGSMSSQRLLYLA